jgi:uncharacterized protein (TIGR02996 family)
VNQNEAFIADIVAHPEDPSVRLIYADWLEEHGDPRADYLRTQAELIRHRENPELRQQFQERLRVLRPQLDSEWVARLDRTRVELCFVPLEIQCPAEWEKMRPTSEPTVRFCEGCRRSVYYCATMEDVRRHARPGHCIAVDSSLPRRDGDVRPGPTPGFPNRSFFCPPGTFVRIAAGEHLGQEGILLSHHGEDADVRLRGETGIKVVRISFRSLELCDGTPVW